MLNNPHEPFKIDQGFGDPVDYGFHDGLDTNGLGGGNTDCGTPLKMIAAGKKVHSSFSNFGFGNIFVQDAIVKGKTYWPRYCHLQKTVDSLVTGQLYPEGTIFNQMGTSGNSTACHLHWSVFKKRPPNDNWRMIAKTRAILDEYFIDPAEFVKLQTKPEKEVMPNTYKGYDLSNLESVHAAFDVVYRIQHDGEELVKKTDLEKLKNDVSDKNEELGSLKGKLGKLEERLKTIDEVHGQEVVALKIKYQQMVEDETVKLRSLLKDKDTEISTLNAQLLSKNSGFKDRLTSRKFLFSSITAIADLVVALAVLFGATPDPMALGQALTALHVAAATFVLPEAVSDHQERMTLANKV